VPGHETAFRVLQQLVYSTLGGREADVKVLDAGCGFTLPVELPEHARLVGLDLSPAALAKHDRLDEAIVGDVETYPLPSNEFDVVLCWTVLEHLERPRVAFENLARAVKPGGLLVIGVPNVWSLKGIVTRLTPYRFHVWLYRHLLGQPKAGMPGFGPYPTHLRRDISPHALGELGKASNLDCVYAVSYRTPTGLPRGLELAWSGVAWLGRVVTLGAWSSEAGDHVSIFRKHESPAQPSASLATAAW
jgi:SAM-dependent methyltransferase